MVVANDLTQLARSVQESTLRAWAADVDAQNRFPRESIESLHEAGLLGFFVPCEMGGPGGDFKTFCQIAAILGAGCLSTALIWTMHCQQLLILADHARAEHGDLLATIGRTGALAASVTSEYGKGGELLTAQAPLLPEGERLRLRRAAPVVSYGAEADFYLITMRAGEARPPSDVSLVLVSRDDGEVKVTGDWNAMGMRGTRSIPMAFDVVVARERVLGPSFRAVALQSMVPAGHLGWTAAWFGGAQGALKRFVRQLRARSAQGKSRLNSDLLLSRLANLRLSLDLIEAMLYRVADQVDSMRQEGAPLSAYEEVTYNIALNNVKVAGSRLAFSVADGLMELAGLSQGYLKEEALSLERVFRDLRSAPLMFHNDRLLDANGRLLLVEDAQGTFW